MSNVTFSDNYIHDIYDSCTHEPAAITAVHSCSGLGYGDGGGAPCSPSCQHPDGVQAYGCNTCDLSNNRVYAIDAVSDTPPAGGQGQGFFFQSANGGTFSNLTFT